MKYLRLVWVNLTRKKVRTTLTIGSFLVALFLFGLLVAIHGAFYQDVAPEGARRLTVINRTSLIMPLPLSYRDQIRQKDGVTDITFATWFGGVYQDERNFFPQFAVDPESWLRVYPEYVVPEEQKAAFLADRQACLVGKALAERFGFELGDRLPLRGTIWPGTWEFNVRGIYVAKTPDIDTNQMLFRHDFLEETRTFGEGTVGWYVVEMASADDAVRLIRAIDGRFENSTWETKTDTEKAFAASFAKQMGNIEFLILSVGSVVFFTLLLVAGNTMATAVRERTGELAVLKTVGYSDRFVLVLVLAEAVLISLQGGVLGLLLAKGISPGLARALPGMTFYLPAGKLVLGLLLAVTIGVAAGVFPAISAMRLKVVDALRRV